MEDPMLSPVTVEVAHAPFPRADLVAGHVAPAAVAQAHATPSRKRQGNVVVQSGNPAALAAKARAPGANAAVRSRPTTEKAGKAASVKRRKVPASRRPPYSTSEFIPPQGGAPAMPLNDPAPPATELFDKMAGRTARIFRSLQGRWENIKPMCSRWAACLEQVRNAPSSGTMESDFDKIAQHRYKDMEASEGKFFKVEHCWELLQKCEKWKLIDKESPPKRGSLINMDEDEDDDGP
ncbi:Lactation elevated protein 1 [Hordeum vulgare]|nr:Lactation elevated protein 1 [Hordeum vulgare]